MNIIDYENDENVYGRFAISSNGKIQIASSSKENDLTWRIYKSKVNTLDVRERIQLDGRRVHIYL